MKTQLITVISIVGVLGTAGAAMAINTTALSSSGPEIVRNGIEVLVPVVEAVPTPEPSSTPGSASSQVKNESVAGSTDTPHPESTETPHPESTTPAETPHPESTKSPDKKDD